MFIDLYNSIPDRRKASTYSGRLIAACIASKASPEILATALKVPVSWFAEAAAEHAHRPTSVVKQAAEDMETAVALGLLPCKDTAVIPAILRTVRRAVGLRQERNAARTALVACQAREEAVTQLDDIKKTSAAQPEPAASSLPSDL